MNHNPAQSRDEPDEGPYGLSQYELWYDGRLDGAAAQAVEEQLRRDPILLAHHQANLAIDASLRRSFGAPRLAPARPVASGAGAARVPWANYATAASVLAIFGAALALTLAPHVRSNAWHGGVASLPLHDAPASSRAALASASDPQPPVPALHNSTSTLNEVFLDALEGEFQPRVACQMQDAWDAQLYTELASAPCNQELGVVVLGEWVDARLDVASMVMLRRGENPIMLVVPRCENDPELCMPKDSGLYVHRGTRDGRTIYEVSPVPGSEILSCMQAQNVVTQQQL